MGITTFALEKIGFDVIGVDILKKYIDRAREYGKKLKSNAKFYCMDAEELKFNDNSFNIVTFLGNPLPHFSIDSLNKSFFEIHRVLSKGGELIVEYTDFIRIFFSFYRWTLVEHNPDNEIMVSIHSGIDTRNEFIKRYFQKKNEEFENIFYLWSPWLVEFIMKVNGFKDIKSYFTSEFHCVSKGIK